MLLTILGWLGTSLSLLGAYLVAKKKPIGFWLFLVADVLLIPPVIQAHVWNSMALYAAYAIINLIGIVEHKS